MDKKSGDGDAESSDSDGEEAIEIEVDPMLKHITGVFDKLKKEIEKVGEKAEDVNAANSRLWNSSKSTLKKSKKGSNKNLLIELSEV